MDLLAALTPVDFLRLAIGLSEEILQEISLYTQQVKGNPFVLWTLISVSTITVSGWHS